LDAQALALRDSADRIEAPDLILPEVLNTAWKKWRRGEMTIEETEIGLTGIINRLAVIHSSADLRLRSMEFAFHLNHPAYDCFYLACAEATQSVLVTMDRALCDAAARAGFGHLVRHLADVPLP
jgi:predicted nucleic acid-binding protein